MRWFESQVLQTLMTSALAVLFAAAIGAPAHAQAIYRCVQKGKPVSLQSEPCDGTAKTMAIRPYVPERASTANEIAWQRYRVEQEMAARNEALRRTSVTSVVEVPVDALTCAQAKAERDEWERRMGLKRDIDGMRFWQERVYEACR